MAAMYERQVVRHLLLTLLFERALRPNMGDEPATLCAFVWAWEEKPRLEYGSELDKEHATARRGWPKSAEVSVGMLTNWKR